MRRLEPVALLLCLGLTCLLLALCQALPAAAESRQTEAGHWSTGQGMMSFYRATVAIKENALWSPDSLSMVREALNAYLKKHDPYASFLTPKEYQRYKRAHSTGYIGVGMDIYPARDGNIICVPFDGGPARKAGISLGDRLTAIDGKPVKGLGLDVVTSRIRGARGTSVALTVRNPEGFTRTRKVQRVPIKARAVSVRKLNGIKWLRLAWFDKRAVRDLARQVKGLDAKTPLLIDLRANRGGDFDAGVAAARLFLRPGERIVTLSKKAGDVIYKAEADPVNGLSPLVLLQDAHTASAAEVFIAALTANGRARSLGERSFGKGSSQKLFDLEHGAGLILTDAIMHPPLGPTWDRVGLKPDRPMKTLPLKRAALKKAVLELAGRAKSAPAGDISAPAKPAAKPATKPAAAEPVEKAAPVAAAQGSRVRYFACFKKVYQRPEESLLLAGEVRAAFSIKNLVRLPLAPYAEEPAGYQLCTGPFTRRIQAEKETKTLAEGMGEEMAVRDLAPPPEKPAAKSPPEQVTPAKPEKSPPPAPKPEKQALPKLSDPFLKIGFWAKQSNIIQLVNDFKLRGFDPAVQVTARLLGKDRSDLEQWAAARGVWLAFKPCPKDSDACKEGYRVFVRSGKGYSQAELWDELSQMTVDGEPVLQEEKPEIRDWSQISKETH